MANKVNDNGDIISRLLRIVKIPICVSSRRSGGMITTSPIVHGRLYSLMKRRIFSNNGLGGALLTACLFTSSARTSRIGKVVRPEIGRRFER